MNLGLTPQRAALTLSFTLVSSRAFADKVAVLPFISGGNATSGELEAAQAATRSAVTSLPFSLPTDAEMLTAQMSSKDGVADTSQEYRAAGRASGSEWTLVGHVTHHGAAYRLELEVCQVASGRVESLAREIDSAAASPEIREMLVLLLRPEGIGTAEVPWEHAGAPPKPLPGPVLAPVPQPPPAPAARHTYAEGHPLALGVGASLLGALQRPANAVGASTALLGDLTAAYALDAVKGLELRGNFQAAFVGPGSVSLEAGALYAIAVLPTARLFVGPEVTVGGFFTTGGEKTARFLAHGSAFAALGVGERIQLEIAADLEGALGGSTALILAGGTARALLRF